MSAVPLTCSCGRFWTICYGLSIVQVIPNLSAGIAQNKLFQEQYSIPTTVRFAYSRGGCVRTRWARATASMSKWTRVYPLLWRHVLNKGYANKGQLWRRHLTPSDLEWCPRRHNPWETALPVLPHSHTVIPQLSSHKIMKKSGFNIFSNLLVFTANQTWQLVIKMVNTKHYHAEVHDLI